MIRATRPEMTEQQCNNAEPPTPAIRSQQLPAANEHVLDRWGLLGWMVGWLVGRLVGWPVEWLSGCFVAWLGGCVIGFFGWLLGCLVGRVVVGWLLACVGQAQLPNASAQPNANALNGLRA